MPCTEGRIVCRERCPDTITDRTSSHCSLPLIIVTDYGYAAVFSGDPDNHEVKMRLLGREYLVAAVVEVKRLGDLSATCAIYPVEQQPDPA